MTNNGLITATDNYGIRNGGSIDNLTNSGKISANRYGIRNFVGTGRLIGTLTNSGEISAIDHSGIRNDGIIETLNNSGEIKAKNQGIWTNGSINLKGIIFLCAADSLIKTLKRFMKNIELLWNPISM